MRRWILSGLGLIGLMLASASAGFVQNPDRPRDVVRIGAVAYSPSVVTVFNNLRQYLTRHGLPSDYVIYSNYDALVEALDRGEVEIAWNTPLAHARYHVRNGCSSRTLVMRDVDCDVRSVLITRTDSGIRSLADLRGRKLILGSTDAAEATVLPLHYLAKEGVDLSGVTIVSLDKEVDFKGNPCCSPTHVLQALREGRGDAGIVTESLWNQSKTAQTSNSGLLKVWTSPPFSHCVFTASTRFDESHAKRFTELMTSMDWNDPACADLMRLEGTKRWLPGSPVGFADLVEAIRK